MGMRVYYSERIEDLAQHLKLRLLAERSAEDAFAFSRVVVPNANIAKWLRIRAFADAPSLCAGMEFPFIEQALSRAMNASLGLGRRAELLPMNAYANGIMSILLGERDMALEPFRRYIAAAPGIGGGEGLDYRKAWQLSVKLADLMDEYEVRRPDITGNWLRGRGMNGGGYADATEAAEAAMARRLFGEGGRYPPDGTRLSLRQLYERVEAFAPGGPRGARGTFRFFGLSTLTPLQVRILRWLAKGAEVEVYHNNVCLEYWGDIETKREERRLREICRTAESDGDFRIENPLLREWGVAGRETMRLLARLEEEGDEGVPFEWHDISQRREKPSSVLSAVQRAICRRTGEAERRAQDATLQVVAAPGMRREVETVHNAILALMLRGDCGDFSDVAVLVTDMRRYRPMIEAVFNGRDAIPYGLIDTSVSGESDCLAAFGALMGLAQKGVTRATLFAVLGNPCVQRALGFGVDDVRSWREAAERSGAYEGFGGDGGEYSNFTWGAGLERLRLGFVADDSPDCAVCQCGDKGALKFSEVSERICREILPLGEAIETSEEWERVLGGTIADFIDTGDDMREESVRRSICETLATLRQIPGEHPVGFVAAAVEELVGGKKASRNGYLTRGVTVASLQPMRPVPFRNVFVLGMGEGDFPGRESATTLDMRGAKRGLGDASLPMQNRYLFLETVMAARERLVISYPSLDRQKDATLFPSGLVGDLEKFVADSILPEGEKFREIPVPLLERGEEGNCPLANPVGDIDWNGYWAGIIPTYSLAVRRLAARIANGDVRQNPCGERKADGEESAGETTAKELADFIVDPLQGILHNRFGVRKDYGELGSDDIPLELPDGGLVKRQFDEAVLKSFGFRVSLSGLGPSAHPPIQRTYDYFAEHGKLPLRGTFFGDYSFRRIAACAEDGFLSAVKELVEESFEFPVSSCDEPKLETGNSQCVVIVGNSEYDAKRKAFPVWPPKATLEPFVNWLKAVAEKDGEEPRALVVGIVDFRRMACAKWEWSGMTPCEAREALEAMERRYRGYAARAAADGRYVKTGYRRMTDALAALKLSALPEDGDEALWRALVDAMMEPFLPAASKLVVSATKEELERLPRVDEWQQVRDFCRDMLPAVLKGRLKG